MFNLLEEGGWDAAIDLPLEVLVKEFNFGSCFVDLKNFGATPIEVETLFS